MRNFCMLFLLVAILIVTGCMKLVHKDWLAVKGSKGDGTVTMGLSWDPGNEILDHNLSQALEIAKEKCRGWGYDSAEAFGGIVENCTRMTYTTYGPICSKMQAEAMFQCKDLPTTEDANLAKNTKTNATTRK